MGEAGKALDGGDAGGVVQEERVPLGPGVAHPRVRQSQVPQGSRREGISGNAFEIEIERMKFQRLLAQKRKHFDRKSGPPPMPLPPPFERVPSPPVWLSVPSPTREPEWAFCVPPACGPLNPCFLGAKHTRGMVTSPLEMTPWEEEVVFGLFPVWRVVGLLRKASGARGFAQSSVSQSKKKESPGGGWGNLKRAPQAWCVSEY